MTASALFQIDPGTAIYGTAGEAQDAAASATVNCRLVSTSGVTSIAWRIFGTHGVSSPTITLSGNPTGQIASFDMGSGLAQAYGIECKVNGGEGVTGNNDTTAKSAVYVLDSLGNRPFFIGETYESDSDYGVVVRLNAALSLRSLPTTAVSSSPYTVLDSDVVILIDTTSSIEIDLPLVADNAGRELWIKDATGNAASQNIIIDCQVGETLDGADPATIGTNWGVRHIYCDGSEWFILSN